jgi:superfamily II DNA or RNA helicase
VSQVDRSSSAEDIFVEIFQEAVGFHGAQSLQFQLPCPDIDGSLRSIDYALISPYGRYAFEVDGEMFHDPGSPWVSPEKYRDDLKRQNSLIYQGWRVYRWTDYQLSADRHRTVEQLRLFLELEIASGALSDILPRQDGAEVKLHAHQSESLADLQALRAGGGTIALVTHATGTGKTHVAVSDARSMGLRTLYVAHRRALPEQTRQRFAEIWPDVVSETYRPDRSKPLSYVVLSTVQALSANLSRFDPHEFGYIIIDEAHHAAADTYRKVISYFRPRFLLGLTATPERADDRSILDIFRNTAHRLDLEEAIRREILVPIRCVRVKTNVDLTRVRFNGIDYRIRDLEEALQLPGRDTMVAETYRNHALGKRGVCFCVDVNHAKRMAAAFQEVGVSAASVDGAMPVKKRDGVLADYEAGRLTVLCACDILSEGWDSPLTEVLLMARPTLSRIVYVQQLGRGTRKAVGKDCLLVFDFIDNTVRHAQALSVHGLLKRGEYRPGALVAATGPMLQAENDSFAAGETPTAISGLHLYATHFEVVDVFRWQDEVEGMLQASELAVELRVDDETIRERVRRGDIKPDRSVSIGSREYYYFRRECIPELQKHYGVEPLTAENIHTAFVTFVAAADMSASYKPVLLLGML